MKGVFILSHGALRKENQFLRREDITRYGGLCNENKPFRK